MRNYEALIIVDATLEEEARNITIDKVKAEIEKNGGEITSVDEWGKKRLAYAIDFKKEGYYVLINFNADIETPKAIERIFRITETILKGLIIKLEN